MKKIKTPLVAFFFLTVSVLFIANHTSFLFFLPAQQVELSHGVEYGAVLKDFLFVQEITMQKRFISRIDVYMAKLPSQYSNENVFLLLDNKHRILFTKKFSSTEIGEALYFPFDFKKSFDIGKGNKVYACLYSIDGNQNSYIGLAKKENSNLGKLYVVSIMNNDIVQSFEKRQSIVDFKGSIGIRTFESGSKYFTLFQMVLYLVAVALSLLIFFSERIKPFVLKTRIKPEYAFLGISLFFGLILVVINPPFQVPDEPTHLYRSYQVAELNIYKFKDDIPRSLVDLASICNRMQFSTHEKTTRNEILSLADIKLNPGMRTSKETPNYTIPYIPQALGIVFGKILHLNPLWLLYLGRVFNLLVSVILVFLAIKTTPVFKWIFFLLGIMPMTLYQFSSLSYDALTISLSFLLVSTILNYALNEDKSIGSRELLVIFLLSGLLAAAKPPYFIIAFSFLIIPVVKIGSWKKFALIFTVLISTVLIISQLWTPGRKLFERFIVPNDPSPKTASVYSVEESIPPKVLTLHNPLAASLPLLPHTGANSGPAAEFDSARAAVSPYDPPAQKKFILDDPGRYIGIMFDTILKSIGLYMVSFIGMFGWIDTPLPNVLVYIYLFVLFLVSIGFPSNGIQIGLLRKCILFAVFLTTFVLIETAMYLYCNPVGSFQIIAVQGRYFIAIGPILFLLLYNGQSHRIVGNYLSEIKDKSGREKQRIKKKSMILTSSDESLLSKLLPWFVVVFGSFSLIYSLYVILERFYVLTL